jgi:hypothetical protein
LSEKIYHKDAPCLLLGGAGKTLSKKLKGKSKKTKTLCLRAFVVQLVKVFEEVKDYGIQRKKWPSKRFE